MAEHAEIAARLNEARVRANVVILQDDHPSDDTPKRTHTEVQLARSVLTLLAEITRLEAELAKADRINGDLANEMKDMDPLCPKCRSSKECMNILCPTRPTRSALEGELATAVEMNRRLVAESDAAEAEVATLRGACEEAIKWLYGAGPGASQRAADVLVRAIQPRRHSRPQRGKGAGGEVEASSS